MAGEQLAQHSANDCGKPLGAAVAGDGGNFGRARHRDAREIKPYVVILAECLLRAFYLKDRE